MKHGHAKKGKKSRTYNVWASMIARCSNPNDSSFKNYGGREIKVCKRWSNKKNGFQNFLSDMGEIPRGLTLDRINNNKEYSPKNCKLSTMKEQERNKRDNHLIPYNDKNLCLAEWSEISGIKQETIRKRLKHGWSIKKALTIPSGKYNKKKKIK